MLVCSTYLVVESVVRNRYKPQPTLKGYTAWAFERLAGLKGIGSGVLAERIIDEYLERRHRELKEMWGISPEEYSKQVVLEAREEEMRESSLAEDERAN